MNEGVGVNACRACLDINDNNNIVICDELLEKYESCTGLKISSEDDTIKVLCQNCMNILELFSSFKNKCQQSDNFWKTFLNKEKIKKPEDFFYQCGLFKLYNSLYPQYNGNIKQEDAVINDDSVSRSESPDTGNVSDYVILKEENAHDEPELSDGNHCTTCNRQFKYKRNLSKHKKICSRKLKVRKYCRKVSPTTNELFCGLCNSVMENGDDLVTHIEEHAGKSELDCKLCDFSGADFAITLAHRFTHQPMNAILFWCHLCGVRKYNARKLEFHYRGEHLKKKPGLCHECGASFNGYRSLKFHEKIHLNEQYECDMCGLKFKLRRNLLAHIRYHNAMKRYVCHHCGYSSKKSVNLKDHIASRHSARQSQTCDQCGKIFVSSGTLKRHKMFTHETQLFECSSCPRKFPKERLLRNHMKWHSDLRPYECELCDLSYKAKGALKIHMRLHTGERPFKCEVCSSAYASSNQLKNHMKVHSDKFHYFCDICNRQFKQRHGLKKHMESLYHEIL